MTEQVEGQEGTEVVVEQQEEISPIEQKALEMGWRPKDEFDGDEEDFIDAKEFVRRKPLFERIEHQSKELKAVRRALEEFKGHYSKVQETEYKRALSELKATQRSALAEGDIEKYHALNEAIEEVQDEAKELAQERNSIQIVEEQVHPVFAAWLNRNPWYESQKHMRVFAEDLGNTLKSRGVHPEDILKQIEQAVKKEFPNKFTNPNRASAPAVEGSARRSSAPVKETFELNEQEKRIMHTLTSGPNALLTKEQYIKDLKAAKGMK